MDDIANTEHRRIGVALFNGAWELIDKHDRTDDETVEMLLRAAASRWHWSRVGGVEEIATGDWQVAHAAALAGLPDVATMFARRNLDTALANQWTGWKLGSAHEGMARACAANGDGDGRAHHVAAAAAALAAEPDVESRDLIASQLATVPEVS